MEPIAVINEAHKVCLRIQAWMLKDLGYKVFVAGDSFRGVVENYHNSGQKFPELSGTMELRAMPQDALFLDTHPKTIGRLRERGWYGPILMVWYMPVGPDWVRENFKPGPHVASLAWSKTVAAGIRDMNVCPSDFFFPPYYGPLDQTERSGVGDYLITCVENAAGWSNVGVLQQCRDHSELRLQLYGGGPPDWSRKIPQAELFKKIRESRAMYHLKPFDTPGLAVMEAVLQGVPLIFPDDWVRLTGFGDIYEDRKSCFIVETKLEQVLEVAACLKDPETNYRIGREGRRRLLAEMDWGKNREKLMKLIQGAKA